MSPPEKMIPRREIPAEVRRITGGGKNPHEQTIRRWYTKGINGVCLQVQYLGGEVFTTSKNLMEFFEAVTVARLRAQRQPGSQLVNVSARGRVAQAKLARRLAK